MTGTMLRAAVVEAINAVRTNGVRPQDFETVIKYALEVFKDDARKVRPCVYIVLDSVGGFSKEEKAATWDRLAEMYIGRKVYKANPMAKLDAMLADCGK